MHNGVASFRRTTVTGRRRSVGNVDASSDKALHEMLEEKAPGAFCCLVFLSAVTTPFAIALKGTCVAVTGARLCWGILCK